MSAVDLLAALQRSVAAARAARATPPAEPAERRYRVGDTVRVVATDPRWVGQVGTVTSADYDRSVPLVVDLPDAPECPPGIGICFTAKHVELVTPTPLPTEVGDVEALAAIKWNLDHYGPLDAEPFQYSKFESPAHAALAAVIATGYSRTGTMPAPKEGHDW